MNNGRRTWYGSHSAQVHALENHLFVELDARLQKLCAMQPEAVMRPCLRAVLMNSSLEAAEARADIEHTFDMLALLVVREADRLSVRLPRPDESIAAWLVNVFLPPYKAALPGEP